MGYITVTYICPETDEEVTTQLPSKNEVCSRCEGFGTHLTPSIGEHAYTAEEFAEAFDDDESRAEYFKRGGIYDVACHECHGRNVVTVVDEDACVTDEQKEHLRLYRKKQAQRARWDAEDRATMRMESGGYQ